MRTIVTLLILAVVLVLGGYVYVNSGLSDVAATPGSQGFLDQIAHRVSDESVARHAAGIQAPPWNDPAQLRLGAAHYEEMCVTCHGAPGVKMSEIGAGLNPSPPNLIRSTLDMSDANLLGRQERHPDDGHARRRSHPQRGRAVGGDGLRQAAPHDDPRAVPGPDGGARSPGDTGDTGKARSASAVLRRGRLRSRAACLRSGAASCRF